MEPVTETAKQIDWVGLFNTFKSLTSIVTSVASNPVGWAIGVGVVGLVITILILSVKRWLKNKEIEAAQRETERQIPEQREERIPENAENNDRDNDNRSKLDQL